MPRRRLSLEVPVELLDIELLVEVSGDYSPPDTRPIGPQDVDPPDPGEFDWWLTGCKVGDLTIGEPDMIQLRKVLDQSKAFAEMVEEAAHEHAHD